MERADVARIRAIRGPKGDPGVGIHIDGVAANILALPLEPADNAQWLIGDDLYIFIDGAWVNAGPIRGPQGTPGAPGMQGPQGVPGLPGLPGSPVAVSIDGGNPTTIFETGVDGGPA